MACVEASAITRPAPIGLPSWTASEPTPPAAATIATDSPGPTRARRAVQVPRGQALDEQRQRGAVVHAVGDREGQRLGRRRVLGVAAGAAEGDDALAGVLAHAGHLAARHERQLLGREVVVAALVGVGEVHTRARDPDEDLAVAGLGDGQVDELQDLGAAELLLLDGAHGGGSYGRAECVGCVAA